MDAFVNLIGFSAGVMVSASLVPQIWRTHKRKSAEDLSFIWQATVAMGVTMQLIYLHHYDMWAVFYPLAVELALIIYLAAIKMHYDQCLFAKLWSGLEKGGSGKLGPLLSNSPGGGGRGSGGGGSGGQKVAASWDDDEDVKLDVKAGDREVEGGRGGVSDSDHARTDSQGSEDEVEDGRRSTAVQGPAY